MKRVIWVEAVDKLEARPDSEGRKATLQEEVDLAKVNEDEEIRQLAQALLKLLDSEDSTISKFNVEFQGEVKGAQVGDGNTQTNTFS